MKNKAPEILGWGGTPRIENANATVSEPFSLEGDVMTVNLYRVIQPVKDIEGAARFYSEVLGLSGERVSPGRHYFHCGSTVLACYDPVKDGDGLGNGWQHHFNQYLFFAVPDLEHVLSRVREAGGEIEGEIESMPWGERMFYAKDPFGNPISFVDKETVFLGSDANT